MELVMNSLKLLVLFIVFSVANAEDRAFADIVDDEIVFGNSLFNATFRQNATIKSLYKNGVNLVANIDKNLQTWYLDWNGERAYFTPSDIKIDDTYVPERVSIVYTQEASEGLLYIELHMVVFANVSGIYQYIKVNNPTNDTITLAEFRTVHRFDDNLMSKVSNMIISGPTPDVSQAPTIQDTTWQLPDGSYWSKYDLCGYIRETPWIGVYGGGFGCWVVSASREYHSAGPLKQELLVHQNSLMLNYYHSTHFGTPSQAAPTGWSKFYGPVLIYINTGSDEEVLEDVATQAGIEKIQWPYQWVDEPEYPLVRGSVTGRITGQQKAMVVVYDSLEEEFDLQTLGYLYHSETGNEGDFTINNIRPGDYQVVAYPLAGHGSENLAKKIITVKAGETLDIGELNLPEPTDIVWSLGETNRRSDQYHYSDEHRNFYWHLLPPANLTFQIGVSNLAKDWYYAQTRTPGVWKINYNDQIDNQGRILRVAFAAASISASITIEVNGVEVGHFAYENDSTIYRDALQSGRFHSEVISVPADVIVDGTNVVSFRLIRGMFMYDAISMAKDV